MLVFVLAITTTISLNRQMFISAAEHADNSMVRMSSELDTLCVRLDVLTTGFQSNTSIKELLTAESFSNVSPQIIDSITENVSYIKSLYRDIADIAFVNDLVQWSSIYSETDLKTLVNESISEKERFGHGLGLYKSSFPTNRDKTFFVYSSPIYKDGKALGYVFISLDVSKLTLNFANSDNAATFFLMDTDGNYYALSDNSSEFEQKVLPGAIEYVRNNENATTFSEKLRSYYTKLLYSENAHCYLISSIYIPSAISSISGSWIQMLINILSVTALLVLLLTLLFRNLITPLNHFSGIIKSMRDEKKRHLTEPIVIDGCAEVADLSSAFTDLFSTIDELNVQIFETSSKLYEEKIRGQATEISYFRSQINPHFLYNVLELVRSEALKSNAPEIAAITVAMGKMYRYNTKGSPIVCFEEELEMTKAYVEIQKYRFKDKFEIFYNIPEEALKKKVIKMILQPIVENAINHGIEPSIENCTLFIGCTFTDDEFIVEVRDDGVGMNENRLNEIQTLLNETTYNPETYVGILNTNARLKLQYGTEYGISIESHENDGTIVQIHMPQETKESEI